MTTAIFTQNLSTFFVKYISKFQLFFLIALLVFYFKWAKKNWFLIVSFIAIYIGGHFLFHLETRFFIMPNILLMICTIIAAINCMHKFNFIYVKYIVGLITIAIIIKTPILQLLQFNADPLPKQMYALAKKHKLNHTIIAAEPGFFEEALYLSFYTNSKCVGTVLSSQDSVQ